MTKEVFEWLPLDIAATRWGYTYEGLRRRLRQLRQLNFVVDVGRPPADYSVGDSELDSKIVIMWPNPQTALIRSNVPPELLNPKRGKRSRKKF